VHPQTQSRPDGSRAVDCHRRQMPSRSAWPSARLVSLETRLRTNSMKWGQFYTISRVRDIVNGPSAPLQVPLGLFWAAKVDHAGTCLTSKRFSGEL
jgi:hypothetical protein